MNWNWLYSPWIGVIGTIASIIGLIITFYQIRQGNMNKKTKMNIKAQFSANGKTRQLKFLCATLTVSLFATGGSILFSHQEAANSPYKETLDLSSYANDRINKNLLLIPIYPMMIKANCTRNATMECCESRNMPGEPKCKELSDEEKEKELYHQNDHALTGWRFSR
jgi:hypothetical protein